MAATTSAKRNPDQPELSVNSIATRTKAREAARDRSWRHLAPLGTSWHLLAPLGTSWRLRRCKSLEVTARHPLDAHPGRSDAFQEFQLDSGYGTEIAIDDPRV